MTTGHRPRGERGLEELVGLGTTQGAFERLAFQNGAHGVQSQTFSADLHADLRLAGRSWTVAMGGHG